MSARTWLVVALLGCRGPRPDVDGDGYIDSAYGGTDCADADADVNPDGVEVACDGVDQDCDGVDLDDVDGDGWPCDEDCDDDDATRHPDAEDVPYDGVDQDCDGADVGDADGDGHVAAEADGDDCDDAEASVHPGAAEVAYDGIDQDCDGADLEDVDEDGWTASEVGGWDCDDLDPAIHPGAPDARGDGVDQDCDGHDPEPPVYGACGEVSAPWGTLGVEDLGAVIETLTPNEAWSMQRLGAGAGDFDANGDGWADLALDATAAATPMDGELLTAAGAVYILYGPRCGEVDPFAYDAVIRGTKEYEAFGAAVAPLGDMNGDGYDDLGATSGGLYWFPKGGSSAIDDQVRILFGPLAGEIAVDGEQSLTVRLTPGGGRTWWMYGRVDLTGDGVDDVFVHDAVIPGPLAPGEVALDDSAWAKVPGVEAGSVWSSVSMPVGDVNGDGWVDVAGNGFIVYGPLPQGTFGLEDADVTIPVGNDGVQAAVDGVVGDANGDGRDDVIVNIYLGDPGPIVRENGVMVLSGDLLDARSPMFFGLHPAAVGIYAEPLDAPVDLDGDGVTDLAVGYSGDAGEVGDVRVWYGPLAGTHDVDAQDAHLSRPPTKLYEDEVYQVHSAGDHDGDGTTDLLIEVVAANENRGGAWLLLGGPR